MPQLGYPFVSDIISAIPCTKDDTHLIRPPVSRPCKVFDCAQADSSVLQTSGEAVSHDMKFAQGLTLQHFMLQTEIAKSYRHAVRATRVLPDYETRRETLDFLRIDLEKLRGERDIQTLRATLANFNRNNKHFLPSLGLSTAGYSAEKPPRLIGQRVSRQQTLVRRFFE